MSQKPILYVVAGPNGAGKTTFAKRFLPEYAHCRNFINPDLIASGLSPFAPELARIEAGRLMLAKINQMAALKRTFAIETTLAGRSYLTMFKRLKARSYSMHLFYLWLPSVNMAIQRVADRVRQGGHNIPESDIRRRFSKSLPNLLQLYRPVFDSLHFFDNSGRIPQLIFEEWGSKITINDKKLYASLFQEQKS